MAYIDVIQPEVAEGALKEIYDGLLQKRGKLAEVHKIQSLHPQSILDHMNLYMTVMFGKSPLKRQQREMMAVVVSKANDCEYCQIHHAEALHHYWKDQARVNLLRKNYTQVDLDLTDQLLCDLAWNLTKFPGAYTEEKYIQPLKIEGLSDRAILDATLVVGYFNFVNRLVIGLGVAVEGNAGGYYYGD